MAAARPARRSRMGNTFVEVTRPKIESRDLIFFTGTQARSQVSRNDWLLPRGPEFGPESEITGSPGVQTRPQPDHVWGCKRVAIELKNLFTNLHKMTILA